MEIGGLFTPVITQFFIRNQPANAGDSIKPWVERSGTQRKSSQNPQACGAGDRDGLNADCDERLRNQSIASSCRPLRGLDWLYRNESLGFAALHPRLYADACSAG